MTGWVALLRAVNLGPHNRIAMADLKRICEEAGFDGVRTHLASGNVVFASAKSEAGIKAELERRLKADGGCAIDVIVRSAKEMAAIVADFPYRDNPGSKAVIIFLDKAPPRDALDAVTGRNDETLTLGKREIYVRCGEAGIGRSKLNIPAARGGTARNRNTVEKLAEMAGSL